MKASGVSFLALIVGCWAAQAADSTSAIKQAVKAKAEEVNQALLQDDFARIADLTHPAVVRLAGGREQMIEAMASGTREMKANGCAFRSIKVYPPSDLVPAGSDLFTVVPFELEMTIPDARARTKSFVIGVSGDQGKSWVFVNGDMYIQKVRQVLPTLPKRLKLPEKQKPVVERN